MGKISAKDPKTLAGVGFDQHYTDSTLRLLAPRSYGQHRKLVRTSRSVPKQEVLVSLLLFGKAYLSRPTWLYGAGFPELERFEREGLIQWMPNDVYDSSYDYLEILILRLLEKAWFTLSANLGLTTSFDDLYERGRHKKEFLERELRESDISHDISVMMRNIFYLSPLVRANMEHLGSKSEDPKESLLWPAVSGSPMWIPFAGHPPQQSIEDPEDKEFMENQPELYKGSYLERLFKARTSDGYDGYDALAEVYGLEDEEIYGFRNEFATVLDVATSSLAAEKFSARTALPFKTSGDVSPSQNRGVILGPEAYQLLKIQFHDLRYPVVQSIGDVLRLREDPHLRTYRSVIAEYSERLRTELESERPQVIRQFRNDMQSALDSLTVVKRWSKIIDLSFYLSIPLFVVGMFSGLPISDILAIPLTAYAKIVSHQKRKELDWILFGRSGN
jgi:hypothetical protein